MALELSVSRQNPHDKSMKTTYSKLVVELSELPSSGPNYTGLHPAWCFVIACICTAEESDYAQLLCIFKVIGMRSKSVSRYSFFATVLTMTECPTCLYVNGDDLGLENNSSVGR